MPKFLNEPSWIDKNGQTVDIFTQMTMNKGSTNGNFIITDAGNTGIGNNVSASTGCGKGIIEGAQSTVMGYEAGSTNTMGVTVGYEARHGQEGVSIGYHAGRGVSYSTPGASSIAIGSSAICEGTRSIAIGSNASASGESAVAIGSRTSTSYATAVASGASAIAIGPSTNAGGTGSIAIGPSAGTTGAYSIAIGIGPGPTGFAGNYSVAIGYGAYAPGSTTQGSVAIGYQAKVENSGTDSIAIGPHASTGEGGSHVIQLGNNSYDYTFKVGKGTVTVQSGTSDPRLKEDIEPANTARCLEDVNALPVSRYKYKDFMGPTTDVHRTGWLATDVERVFPKNVVEYNETYYDRDENGEILYDTVPELDEEGNPIIDENGNPVTKQVPHHAFVIENVKHIVMQEALPTLWGAVQELTKLNEQLTARVAQLESRPASEG